jgi:phage major tail protein, phi13 family
MAKPTIITGINKAYIALQTKDDSTGLSFGSPKYYAGIQELGFKPKQNTEQLYAENQVWDQATAFQQADIDVSLASLTSAQRAELLGQSVATGGGVFASATDIAPYVALLYKATIAGGFRYGVFYKGMFQIPDETIKGQEGKVAYAVPKLSATFIPTINNAMWEYHIDTTDPNCPVDIDTTWFTAVAVPNVDTTVPTITTVPLNAATGVLGSASVAFTSDKAVDTSTITDSNIFLMKSGVLVSATLSVDTTGKIVTLKPTSTMSTGSYTAVCSKNVKSAAGIPLASTIITNFTV